MKVIDSHIHCGIQNSDLPFELIRRYLASGNIQGACLYAPVEDIYNRYDEHFEDSAPWIASRQRANEYVLKLQQTNEDIFGYYFVWNDFRREELKKGYRGVKWHRHEYEPLYNYDDPRCEDFLQEIYRLQLPVVLEESFENTLYMLRRIDGRTPVIIPHMGGLNGGFTALFQAKIWDDESVFADTALATPYEMDIFLKRYGSNRLLFGSDFPFGYPGSELAKVQRLKLREEDYEKVVSTNILHLMKAPA
jgi:predicted TIM-barrel fold metal-dependent hydrolase